MNFAIGRAATRRLCRVAAIRPPPLQSSRLAEATPAPRYWRNLSGSRVINHAIPNSQSHESTSEPPESRTARADSSFGRKGQDRPWHRQDKGMLSEEETDTADPTGGDKGKGRLLTTPTRLLKLILPLPFRIDQEHINESEAAQKKKSQEKASPLAILVHPHQPLSYLERLLQAELPPLKVGAREKLPDITFRAEADRQGSKENIKENENVASYSGLGREGPDKENEGTRWVRWSGSTELGDFIRDAARGREFAVGIEGYDKEIRVAVPSFGDRTYYMRMRLRRASREIDEMAKVKRECDLEAHRAAHRLAQGGFAVLTGWWGIVYYVTFHTDFGWDLVEPVTYLAGLTTIMGGYLWFLFISRDLSYKAAMNITVSRRQNALYQNRGFNLSRWEGLVQEANGIRKEIKMIATEYDVDWDETKDLGGKGVKKVLEKESDAKKERNQHKEDDTDKVKGDGAKSKD